MSKWLQRARSQNQCLPPVPNVPIVPKVVASGSFGTFGNFGTGGEDRKRASAEPRQVNRECAEELKIDQAEREAIAIELGGVPAVYASSFARLQAEPPAEVPRDRRHQSINDAGLFLDHWGRQAEALGWRTDELFGLDPVAPMARYDRMGFIWLLKGERVVALTATGAKLSGGLTFYGRADCSVMSSACPRQATDKRHPLYMRSRISRRLSRFDVWLQAVAGSGSGSGQTAVKSNPTAIPTETSRNRWMAIIHAGSARATSMTISERNPRVPKRVSPDAKECADRSEHKYAGTKRGDVLRRIDRQQRPHRGAERGARKALLRDGPSRAKS